MLLWVLILALSPAPPWPSSAATCRPSLRADVLAVQAGIAVGLPALHHPGLQSLHAHPARSPKGTRPQSRSCRTRALAHRPCLYAGYVGLSMAFAVAVAALSRGRVDAAWACWAALMLPPGPAPRSGSRRGSWWAYYELGWGGWWFWDLVENGSLKCRGPRRRRWTRPPCWRGAGALIGTVLLANPPFSLSRWGTFLVRSGILNQRARLRRRSAARNLHPGGSIGATDRGGASTLCLAGAGAEDRGRSSRRSRGRAASPSTTCSSWALTATVFLGTFSPVFIEMLNGDKISVGPP